MAFDPDKWDKILDGIRHGSSLRAACQANGTAHPTVLDWIAAATRAGDNTLADQYARARDIRTTLQVEEMVEIAANPDIEPARARNMIDVCKWTSSRMRPDLYGDRLQHTGADGAGPVVIEIVRFGGGDK